MAFQLPGLKTLVIIVLVIGQTPLAAEPFSALTAISVAGTAISAGTSLAGTTLQGIAATGYRVTCTIQVENWTKYPLLYPTARLGAGALNVAPTAILPGKKEAFATRKADSAATGSYGTASWEVSSVGRRFVLMWSAPFNFNHYSNWLGVGMTRKGMTDVAQGNKWYNQMYYRNSDSDLSFQRMGYYYTTDPVIYRDSEFEIVGVMTNIHRAEVKIIFRPATSKAENLAPTIRAAMGLSAPR